ncbi:hypothetical protein ACJ41O_014165 [Fusarium nematophilum]
MSSTPTSPWFAPNLAFLSSWDEQIREAGAIEHLEAGRYDLFPLSEVRTLTNNLFKTRFNRSIQPKTEDGDVLLIQKLAPLRNTIFAHEAGVLACLHAFSDNQVYGQLLAACERCSSRGPLFFRQAKAYLQFLLVAYDILVHDNRGGFFHEDLPATAKTLLDVVRLDGSEESFPSVIGALQVVGKKSCEEFLPQTLVRMMLSHANYKARLQNKLEELYRAQKWHSAYQLVHGLRELSQATALEPLLEDAFPYRAIWTPWTPDRDRIRSWECQLSEQDRKALATVMGLEGPDTTGHQRHVLRYSFSHLLGQNVDRIPTVHGRRIMDHFFDVLDRAIARGPDAVSLFRTICVEPRAVSWQALARAELALGMNSPSDIRALSILVSNTSHTADLSERVQDFTTALAAFTSTPRLQNTFAKSRDIAYRGYLLFVGAAKYLGGQLTKRQASERMAKTIGGLGRALASATWLHKHWQDRFIEDLRRIPSDVSISAVFRNLKTVPREQYEVHSALLTSRLCLGGGPDPSSASSAHTSILEVPAWSMELDRERSQLRDALFREMQEGLSPEEAVACIKQSEKEHDLFIRELLRNHFWTEDGNTDMACVHLAGFLSRQCAVSRNAKPPEECWRQLLMHKMRRRPPGLLERCADALTLSTTWSDWVHQLRWLYGEQHYDPEGGLGFTREKFNAVTARKLGIGRSVSRSTHSTGGSSGLFY